MNTDREHDDARFVDFLERLAGWRDGKWDDKRVDRAALAALRRSVQLLEEDAAAQRYVADWVEPEDFERDRGWQARCTYLVAALFAMHPRGSWTRREGRGEWWERNLGASFHRLAPPGDRGRESVERRFQWLLASDRHELPRRLRQSITLLASAPQDVPVDWFALLRDVRWWGVEGSRVQARWATAFWRGQRELDTDGDGAGDDEVVSTGDDEAGAQE